PARGSPARYRRTGPSSTYWALTGMSQARRRRPRRFLVPRYVIQRAAGNSNSTMMSSLSVATAADGLSFRHDEAPLRASGVVTLPGVTEQEQTGASAGQGEAPDIADEQGSREPAAEGVIDLLGLVSYASLVAFFRLAEDASLAPSLPDRADLAAVAVTQ